MFTTPTLSRCFFAQCFFLWYLFCRWSFCWSARRCSFGAHFVFFPLHSKIFCTSFLNRAFFFFFRFICRRGRCVRALGFNVGWRNSGRHLRADVVVVLFRHPAWCWVDSVVRSLKRMERIREFPSIFSAYPPFRVKNKNNEGASRAGIEVDFFVSLELRERKKNSDKAPG